MILIISNFFWNFGYQIINIIVPLLLMPYLARVLGVDGIGTFSYIQSVGNIFLICAMLGFVKYGSRAIAEASYERKRLSSVFSEIWGLQIFVTFIVFIAYMIYIQYFSNEYKILFMYQMTYIASCFFDITWFYIGIEKFRIISLRNMALKLGMCILIFIFVRDTNSVVSYVVISSMGYLLANLLLLWGIKDYVDISVVSLKRMLVHLYPSLYFFISILAVSGYKTLDKVIIAHYSNMDQLGYFVNAEKLVAIQLIVSTSIGLIMLPRISKLIARKSYRLTKVLFYKSITVSIYLVILLSCGMFGLANVFIPWFLGVNFLPSIPCFEILLISGIFLAWAEAIRTQYLLPLHMDKLYISSIVCGAILNILLNINLVPFYGAIGASISIVLTEIFIAVYQTFLIRRLIPIKNLVFKLLPFLGIGVVVIVIMRLVSLLYLPILATIILEVIIGASVYIVGSILYCKFFDVRLYKRIISNYYKIRRV